MNFQFSFLALLLGQAYSLSSDSSFSRRDLVNIVIGVPTAYIYGNTVRTAFSIRGIKYPTAHEERVESALRTALVSAATTAGREPLRVLEVGIGADCRLLRRGLYDSTLKELERKKVELTGVDLVQPTTKALEQAQLKLNEFGGTFQFIKDDMTSLRMYPDGYFDSIICCLTLCSVDDPQVALREFKRLLHPIGGTLGYIEHVAVEPDEPYRFLDYQQQILDPLQQAVAGNCHLHRNTQNYVQDVFSSTDSISLLQERFLVDNMWPVSCQCSGVVQRTS